MMDATLYPVMNKYRSNRLLNGTWNFQLDQKNIGIQNKWSNVLPDPEEMPVPGTFSELTTDRDRKYYSGNFWYEKEIFIPEYYRDKDIFVRFGSITHRAKVFINGVQVGQHEGGFLPFAVNITNFAKLGENNHLAILVNNELSESTLPIGTNIELSNGRKIAQPAFDFFNYSGIMRNVWLTALPKDRIKDFSTWFSIDGNNGIVHYRIFADEGQIQLSLLDKNGRQVASGNDYEGQLVVEDAKLWSPDNPYLYTLLIKLERDNRVIDEYSTQIGIRTFKVDGESFLLNNKPIHLKGFGKHEDFNVLGKAINESIIKRDFELMKWIGANCFRTSHYPYAEEWYQYADKYGFLIIDEVPAVGMSRQVVNISSNKDTPFFADLMISDLKKVHKKEIQEMITRDKNHPSVIAWSLFNEPETTYAEAKKYFADIFAFAKKLDPQNRPLTGALEAHSQPDVDEVAQLCDFVSLNRYYGWYIKGGPQIMDAKKQFIDEMDKWQAKKMNKPFIFTEFGTDTLSSSHTLPAEMWSQEYQIEDLKMFFEIFAKYPFIQGELLWNFADFKTADGILRVGGNKKGIFTRDREPKQAAFWLRKIWN